MKSAALSPFISPTVIIAGIVIAVIAIMANSNQRISLVSNLRIDMIAILILGMMMCTKGGARVFENNGWTHPLSILAMLIGAALLVICASVIFSFRLPVIPADFRALSVAAVLIGVKVLVSTIHALMLKP